MLSVAQDMSTEEEPVSGSPLHRGVRRLRTQMGYVTVLPDLALWLALALGWYVRWRSSVLTDGVHWLCACALLLVVGNALLRHLTGGRVSRALYRGWLGAMLALLTLFDMDYLTMAHSSTTALQEVSNMLLVASALGQCLACAVRSCCRVAAPNERRLVDLAEAAELVGFGVVCAASPLATSPSAVLLLLLALFIALTGVKVGSYLCVLCVLFIVFSTQRYLLPAMHAAINPYAAICFLCRLFAPALLDLMLLASGTFKFEKWSTVIVAGRCRQYSLLLALVALQLAFFTEHALAVGSHKEWFVVVPMFIAMSVIWMLLHITLVVICLSLIRRFAKCGEYAVVGSTDLVSLKKVLASRGVRLFSLVAHRLVMTAAVSTALLGVLCWTTRTGQTHSLLVSTVCAELLLACLCAELSVSLGGTCIAYAIVAPNAPARSDGLVSILPPNYIQTTSSQSAGSLQSVIELLTQHLITQYGADWSMAGISYKELEHKLADFFAQRTYEGPRYDTYLLYYSGPTDENGSWALNDGSSLSLDALMQLWDDSTANSTCSRLVVVADCEHSAAWLRPVWRMAESHRHVALQTCQPNKHKPADAERPLIGQLTAYWTAYNRTGGQVAPDLHPIDYRPVYACSRHWTDFAFGLPSASETSAYWLSVMPVCTHRCLAPLLLVLSARLPLTACCNCVASSCSRARIRLWPPALLDTAHGFKLVRL